jgi:hypothetical protein
MQPSWQLFQGLDGPLDLVRETPKAETWQGLKKEVRLAYTLS